MQRSIIENARPIQRRSDQGQAAGASRSQWGDTVCNHQGDRLAWGLRHFGL